MIRKAGKTSAFRLNYSQSATFGEDFFLVLYDFLEPVFADRNALFQAVVIPDSAHRVGLEFFLAHHQFGEAAFVLQFLQFLIRLEQRKQQRFFSIAETCDPCADTVDRSVKVVQRDKYPVQCVAADNLLEDFAGLH